MFRWLFLCSIGHPTYSVSLSCYAIHGLSKCLLICINQYSHSVDGDRTVLGIDSSAHLSASPAAGAL